MHLFAGMDCPVPDSALALQPDLILMRLPLSCLRILALGLLAGFASGQTTNDDIPRDNVRGRFIMYGVAPTKPVLFTPGGQVFYIANQMGDRLAMFDVQTQELLLEIPTGSGLVSLQLRPGTDELWMVDRVTSSLTVYDTGSRQIVRTVRVGADPHDLVFSASGNRAYVSCSGVDRVDVVDTATYAVVKSIAIPARQPRAMARIGTSVYVAAFLSGNGTAPIGPGPNAEPDQVVHVDEVPGAIPLPDQDLFKIRITPQASTDDLDPGATVQALGTTLLNLHVRPGTTELWIPNLDALNGEHHGEKSFPNGQVVRNQISIVDVSQTPPVIQFIDLDALAPIPTERASIPSSVAFSPDGSRAFVTGYGTDRVAVLDVNSGGNVTWAGSIGIPSLDNYPEFSGPRSSAVSPDGEYLVTYNKVDNGYCRVPLSALPTNIPFSVEFPESQSIGYDRMPSAMKRGRGFFDSTKTSLSNTSACFSCHPDGDTDGLAWELSTYLDPEGTEFENLQFGVDVKGPMVTQGVRAMREVGPYHWRGERSLLSDFDVTFESLFENTEGGQLTTLGNDFFYILQYLEELAMSPNPRQPLDRLYTAEQLQGADLFLNKAVQDGQSCSACHLLPLGTNNEVVQTFRGGDSPSIVVPQLRRLERKLSKPFLPGGGIGKRTELGAGLNHGGTAATIEDVALEPDEDGNPLFQITALEARQVADFITALDSGLAPSTGYQFTAHAGNLNEVLATELPFLLDQAAAGHCDVTYVTGPESLMGGVPFLTGMYDVSSGTFTQPSALLPDLTVAELLAKAQAGQPVTFFGVAGLRGKVMGGDRDNDNVRDLDEVLAGTDPESPDTDRDRFPDGYELEWGMDPLVEDSSSPDNIAPTIVGGPTIVYATQTSIKVEFETSEPADVLFFVDGTPRFRRPLDQEFDNWFSYSIGDLTPQTTHTISMNIVDPAGNLTTASFSAETSGFVRPTPVHVEEIRTRVVRVPFAASESEVQIEVDLGDGVRPALPGYEVEVSVYYLGTQGMSVVASARQGMSAAGGTAKIHVDVPLSVPTYAGQLLVVVQAVEPPLGFPAYVEANNDTAIATVAY